MKNTLNYINNHKDLINSEYQDYTQAIAAKEAHILKLKETIDDLYTEIEDTAEAIVDISYSQSDKLLGFLFAKALEDMKSQSPEVKSYLGFLSGFEGVECYFRKWIKRNSGVGGEYEIQNRLNKGESYSLFFDIPEEQPFPYVKGFVGIFKNEAANIAKDFLLKQEKLYSIESIDTDTEEGRKLYYESNKRMREEETQLFFDLQRRFPGDCFLRINRIEVLYNFEDCVHDFNLTSYGFILNSLIFTYHISDSDYNLVKVHHLHRPEITNNRIWELILNKNREIVSVGFEKVHRGKQDNFVTSVRAGESLFWTSSKTGRLPIELLDDIAGCGFTYSTEFYEDHVKGRRKK